jgi:hypothetical protein
MSIIKSGFIHMSVKEMQSFAAKLTNEQLQAAHEEVKNFQPVYKMRHAKDAAETVLRLTISERQ